MPDYGFDTASPLWDCGLDSVNGDYATINIAHATSKQFGRGFFGRYFSPSPGTNVIDESSCNANWELYCQWTYNGGTHLFVLCDPGQDRIGTGGSQGQAWALEDAEAACQAVLNVYDWVGPLQISQYEDIYQCFFYLDVEGGTGLCPEYWRTWAAYIYNYSIEIGGSQVLPFVPAGYIAPTATATCGDSPNTCGVIAGSDYAFGIDTSQPEPCSNCASGVYGSLGWYGDECETMPGYIWQFAEYGFCSSCPLTCSQNCCTGAGCTTPPYPFSSSVDLDEASVVGDGLATMLYLSSVPSTSGCTKPSSCATN
jgi:hypothetical protein